MLFALIYDDRVIVASRRESHFLSKIHHNLNAILKSNIFIWSCHFLVSCIFDPLATFFFFRKIKLQMPLNSFRNSKENLQWLCKRRICYAELQLLCDKIIRGDEFHIHSHGAEPERTRFMFESYWTQWSTSCPSIPSSLAFSASLSLVPIPSLCHSSQEKANDPAVPPCVCLYVKGNSCTTTFLSDTNNTSVQLQEVQSSTMFYTSSYRSLGIFYIYTFSKITFLWNSTCSLPDFLVFCIFVTLESLE